MTCSSWRKSLADFFYFCFVESNSLLYWYLSLKFDLMHVTFLRPGFLVPYFKIWLNLIFDSNLNVRINFFQLLLNIHLINPRAINTSVSFKMSVLFLRISRSVPSPMSFFFKSHETDFQVSKLFFIQCYHTKIFNLHHCTAE